MIIYINIIVELNIYAIEIQKQNPIYFLYTFNEIKLKSQLLICEKLLIHLTNNILCLYHIGYTSF